MPTDQDLSIPLYRFTDLGRQQTAIWKPAGIMLVLLVSLLHQDWDDLFLLLVGALVLLKPWWMLLCDQHAFQTRHRLFRNGQGRVSLERQFCLRNRVLYRQDLNLSRYTWLRVFEPGDGTLALQLGNAADETHTLAAIRPGMAAVGDGSDAFAAWQELVTLGNRISRLTGIENRASRAAW